MTVTTALERLIGSEIGGYRISSLIGCGGMGAVFCATHRTLNVQTAIKVMLPSVSGLPPSAVEVKRFCDEARALAKVQHPSLVRLLDSGELADGTIFIQMELLQGESLRDRLRKRVEPKGDGGGDADGHRDGSPKQGRLPLREALVFTRQIAGALQLVHAHGIVHRDLTPSNIFIVAEAESEIGERAKVLDFGIAKFRDAIEARTESNRQLGTARYMPPEQWDSSSLVDEYSDVYSLGLLLFEMLTGESPYVVAESSPAKWMHAHLDERPRTLLQCLPGVSRELDTLVTEMLDKLPDQRPTMAAVGERLRHCEGGTPAAPLRRAWRPQGRHVTLAALGLASLGAAGIIWPRMHSVMSWSSFRAPTKVSRQIDDAAAATRAPEGMILVPGQMFRMGSTDAEVEDAFVACTRVASDCARADVAREKPQRLVSVRSFFLDRLEVTNQQYADFLNVPLAPRHLEHNRLVYNDHTLLIDLHEARSGIEYQDGKYRVRPGFAALPVVQVTWSGARQYCLSMGHDLPTEAQWELAARGPGAHREGKASPWPWPWGDAPPTCAGVVVARDKGGACERPQPGPAAVGSAAQDITPLGIRDLGGNVREWMLDSFQAPYPECGTCEDPIAADPPLKSAQPATRSVRGGNWFIEPTMARSAARSFWGEDQNAIGIGFRCAAAVSR